MLSWWQKNEERLGASEILAHKYMSVPATSAPSEGVFSSAGNICS